YDAALLWLAYFALEPYARRLWPEALISWSRLLAGQFRDPMVGRDLLVGCVGGALGFLLLAQVLPYLAPRLLGLPPSVPGPALPPLGWLDAGKWPAQVLEASLASVGVSLFIVFLLFLVLRIAFRRDSLAVAASLAFMITGMVISQPTAPFTWVAAGLLMCLYL